jgi:molybdenum cofactor cytidylyltransferase
VVPTWNGKNGHPLLFAWSLVPTIRSLSKDRGLNYLLSSGNQSVAAVPADDAERPDDLDTPEDYDRHRRRIETP